MFIPARMASRRRWAADSAGVAIVILGFSGSGLGDQCISVDEPFSPLEGFGSSSQSRLKELTRENGLLCIAADDVDPEGLSANMDGMLSNSEAAVDDM